MVMNDVDVRKIQLEAGAVFDVADVFVSGQDRRMTVLVPTHAIKEAAASLLVACEAQMRARARRLVFLEGEGAESLRLSQARVAAQESASRYYVLEMLSRGQNIGPRKVVTLADWLEILEHFALATSTGALQEIVG
jgi:hypothetical protein